MLQDEQQVAAHAQIINVPLNFSCNKTKNNVVSDVKRIK